MLYDLVSRGLLSDVALRGALDRCAPVEAVQPQAEATPLEAAAEEVAEAASTADAAAPGEPEPRAEKKQREGLSEIDATTRGLGGGRVVSCGEENLLDIAADPWFRDESVLCHELGHTVMNLGLSEVCSPAQPRHVTAPAMSSPPDRLTPLPSTLFDEVRLVLPRLGSAGAHPSGTRGRDWARPLPIALLHGVQRRRVLGGGHASLVRCDVPH